MDTSIRRFKPPIRAPEQLTSLVETALQPLADAGKVRVYEIVDQETNPAELEPATV